MIGGLLLYINVQIKVIYGSAKDGFQIVERFIIAMIAVKISEDKSKTVV